MHWSKSRHVQYEACPRQFFYEVVAAPRNPDLARLSERSGIALRRHETIRQIISASLRSPEPLAVDLEKLLGGVRRVLGRAGADEYEIESELSIVRACLLSFLEQLPELLEAQVLYVHQGSPVEFVYDGLTMMALPELVLDYPQRTEVICWKTGSTQFRKAAESALLAGGLTCWARSAMRIVSKPIVIREVFLREGFRSHDVSLDDTELREFTLRAKGTRERYAASAKIRDFPAQPGDPCRFCNFRNVCPEYGEHFEGDYGLAALADSVATGTLGAPPSSAPEKKTLFLSHASEDKDRLVRPFARALDAGGISYWLDDAEISWGDSLTRRINDGLRKSTHVVVFITDAFLGRGWPENELGSALASENSEGVPRLLPIVDADWAKVTKEYPLLRDKAHVEWKDGIEAILRKLRIALNRSAG